MTRRFIAGAVCPQCRAVDRIVVEPVTQDGIEGARRSCIVCDFSELQQVEDQGPSRVPSSRLLRPTTPNAAVPAEPVRIVTPPPKKPRV